jgi:hypothetical protein
MHAKFGGKLKKFMSCVQKIKKTLFEHKQLSFLQATKKNWVFFHKATL